MVLKLNSADKIADCAERVDLSRWFLKASVWPCVNIGWGSNSDIFDLLMGEYKVFGPF